MRRAALSTSSRLKTLNNRVWVSPVSETPSSVSQWPATGGKRVILFSFPSLVNLDLMS